MSHIGITHVSYLNDISYVYTSDGCIHISAKEPHYSATEPHISAKEPNISAKEPHISAKEPCASIL